ncbi:uncharacterized protein LOC115990671 [Quercus lobata]|uniref:uncharacterized protein LOC115990671 n=1 Tax=Quercus lobata TaxID=97700 RepID=UPI001247B924|nr:uncharacterized protein LOC115990671 [Quercus lobata]
MWMLHPKFPKVVQGAWTESTSLLEATLNFTVKAKKWNVDVFGNVFIKKKRVLARINGAKKTLTNNPNEFLIQLENKLIEEYATILLQEEEFWALKSRLNVAAFGDRNTSYFHLSTIVRRHKNKIRGIKNREREWIFEEDQVRERIHRGFYDLYSTELEKSSLNSPISNSSCHYFSEEEQERIGREVLEEDIRVGLWSLKLFKAPRPNGLHAGFFQYFWHDVK